MLRDCFGPCFRLMLRLPDSPPTGRTDVRREAERLLEEAGRLALRGREAATVETARRMVEAWMDETALGIAWEGRAAWLGNPLQRRWRTGRRGGDWFFDEIRRLSPHRAEDAELAEVALRCLGFGFRGHFYNDPNGLGLEHLLLRELAHVDLVEEHLRALLPLIERRSHCRQASRAAVDRMKRLEAVFVLFHIE